eukprot:g2900.t1
MTAGMDEAPPPFDRDALAHGKQQQYAPGGSTAGRTIAFDVILGVLGTTATLTAASDFRYHRHARNRASGTLDEEATVSYAEMLEHSFYQGLNLVQILYLHGIGHIASDSAVWVRVALALAATSPWLARRWFPVNHFSDNYNKAGTDPWALTAIMYRVKKYQYLLYKHVLLHGLNLSLALDGDSAAAPLTLRLPFRAYWLALNTSYVMEFFLQTLVKKKYMAQVTMVWLQHLLMLTATVSVLPILSRINPVICACSLALNLLQRGNDWPNTALLAIAAALFRTTVPLYISMSDHP